MYKMQPVRVPHTLPVVLSREEVARLIAAAGNLKHQTALSVAYGAGLRASEVVALKVGDIDSGRMTLRIEQGKGRKDRYAMLAPVLLERLRAWWRVARAQGKMLDGGWLFPGLNPIESLSTRQLNRAVHAAAQGGRDRQARVDAYAALSIDILLHLSKNVLFPRNYALSGICRGQLAALPNSVDLRLDGWQREILTANDPRR